MFLAIIFCSWLLPFWWWVIVIPFLYSFWCYTQADRAFLYGALGAGLAWGGSAYYLQQTAAKQVVARMDLLFNTPHPLILVGISALIAMVAGGFAASSGVLMSRLLLRKSAKS